MLLVIDVGNTNITLGIFDGEKVSGTFRMKSKQPRTSDEYGIMLRELVERHGVAGKDIQDVIIASVVPDVMHSLGSAIKQPRTSDEYGIMLRELVERHGVAGKDIQDVIIASVVPDVMHSLGSAIIKYFGIKPMVVSAGIKTGIRIVTENPRQVGADRIVDAVAAYTLFGGPVIVVDFGTATTYDIIGPDGTFEAGVIAPGIRTSAQALWGEADMLPAIEIRKPASILAKETISSMQGGLLYGQIGQTEYIVKRLKEESGYTDAKVVATGGLGKMIVSDTDVVDVYDPQLTLKGLRIIFEKNKKR